MSGEEQNDGGGANQVELDGGAQEVNVGEIADGADEEAEGPLNEDDIFSEGIIFMQTLLSSGYERGEAQMLASAHISLLRGAMHLDRCKEGPLKDNEVVTAQIFTSEVYSDNEATILSPEGLELMRPEWERFVLKLSSIPTHDQGYITLNLQQLQLGNNDLVSGSLLPALKTAPIKTLLMRRNALAGDSDGMKFVFDSVQATSTLETLFVDSNTLEPEDMLALTKVVTEHRRLDNLTLTRCGMNRDSDQISQAIVDVLQNLKSVNLDSNSMGPRSAKLISACLSKNPIVERLELDDNQFGDEDAYHLALALLSNDNLRVLRLVGNQITQKGWSVLKRALFFNGSMSHIWQHSNHNCYIVSGEETFSSVNNFYVDPDKNRRLKMARCLPVATHANALTVMPNIRDIPIGIVPRILVFVQGLESIVNVTGLDATFRLVRQWNMPLLFTSTAGPCPRRSNRIRAKKVSKLMGK